jgi:hypothetical protein
MRAFFRDLFAILRGRTLLGYAPSMNRPVGSPRRPMLYPDELETEREMIRHLEFVKWAKERGILRRVLYPIEQWDLHLKTRRIALAWRDRAQRSRHRR